MSDIPSRPTFLYIGMPKAASSWMFEILREHPQVHVPIAKNIEFFDRNYHRGFDWYLANFRPGEGVRAMGELSHDYYAAADACERIHHHLPDVRLICCLREPGDFLVSSYNYSRMHEPHDSLGFTGYAETGTVRTLLRYTDNLGRFYDRFPADQIKVVFFDDVRSSPHAVVGELYRFIGVDPSFRPAFEDRKVNAARSPRSKAATQLAFSAARALRSVGCADLVGAVKRSQIVESLLYRPGTASPDGAGDYLGSLRARCRADYPALEDMIGRPLPPSWYDLR